MWWNQDENDFLLELDNSIFVFGPDLCGVVWALFPAKLKLREVIKAVGLIACGTGHERR